MPVFALNLFDLADNDLYRQYSRRSVDAVGQVLSMTRPSGSTTHAWWTVRTLRYRSNGAA